MTERIPQDDDLRQIIQEKVSEKRRSGDTTPPVQERRSPAAPPRRGTYTGRPGTTIMQTQYGLREVVPMAQPNKDRHVGRWVAGALATIVAVGATGVVVFPEQSARAVERVLGSGDTKEPSTTGDLVPGLPEGASNQKQSEWDRSLGESQSRELVEERAADTPKSQDEAESPRVTQDKQTQPNEKSKTDSRESVGLVVSQMQNRTIGDSREVVRNMMENSTDVMGFVGVRSEKQFDAIQGSLSEDFDTFPRRWDEESGNHIVYTAEAFDAKKKMNLELPGENAIEREDRTDKAPLLVLESDTLQHDVVVAAVDMPDGARKKSKFYDEEGIRSRKVTARTLAKTLFELQTTNKGPLVQVVLADMGPKVSSLKKSDDPSDIFESFGLMSIQKKNDTSTDGVLRPRNVFANTVDVVDKAPDQVNLIELESAKTLEPTGELSATTGYEAKFELLRQEKSDD